jgi:2-oxoglutarate ferredoxin oxidoreductase subunit alpha
MHDQSLTLRVGGDSAAGGIVTTGEVFARIAAYAGLEVYTTRTIPAEIKGGHVMFQARIAPTEVWSQGDELDMLVAFDQESIDRYYALIRPGGILVYNSNDGQPPAADYVTFALPLNDLAKTINFQRGRNIITIGALVKLFGLPPDVAITVIEKQLGRRKDLLEQNLLAFKTGYDYVEQHITPTAPYHLTPRPGAEKEERLVLSGNQALAIGAIAAGCRFFAGYPITPASDIMEFLAAELPRVGGTMVQAEDEMAALAMALGASYGGVRAMTATSGPGLALMLELIGHAAMTELPVVVVDVQRAGPSTGMPTKVSQGDLRMSVFGTNDDAPHIVLAPVSVEDNFYLIIHAFNLAEKYQVPVIFLSDQDMSVRVQTVPAFDPTRIPLEPRLLWDPNSGDKFQRYKDTPTGISPMSLPGMPGGQYVAEGLEHNAEGEPNYDLYWRTTNMEKRARKVSQAVHEVERLTLYERFGNAEAAIGIIGWGSTIGPVREAVQLAEAEGIPVAVLYPKMLYPLSRALLEDFIAKRQAIIVPELNYVGQFARMIQAEFGREVIALRQFGGIPFKTRDVYEEIQRVHASLKPTQKTLARKQTSTQRRARR